MRPDEDDLAFFRANGYLLLKGVLSTEEAAALRAEGEQIIKRLAASHSVEATWSSAGQVAGATATTLQHCHDVQFQSGLFNRYLADPRLIDPVAALINTPNVQLHHNKLFIKPPSNGSPFPMHQDWPFFPHANDSTLAAIVHLDDAPLDRGCVRVIPGSHLDGRIDHLGSTDWYLPTDRYVLDDAIALPAEPGDVLYFSCLTVHGSGTNVSDQPRTTWLLQLRDPQDRPTVDRHRSPGQGTMLRGTNTGDAPPPTTL